jgi:uncharacterized protein (UPF0335 family)
MFARLLSAATLSRAPGFAQGPCRSLGPAIGSAPHWNRRMERMDDIVEDAPATAYKVTAAELRQFIERFERLDQEKKDIADQQKEVLAEARGRGYDVKVLRKLIALRKKDPADVSEEEAILEVYKEALGM